MAEPKPLKILTSKPVNDNEFYYLSNNKDSTFIQVPKIVYNTIIKIHNSPKEMRHAFVDVLAMAINKRRLDDVSVPLTNWTNNQYKNAPYPQCDSNLAFIKLIRTFVKVICPNDFSENEIDRLVYFFAKCPHGYDVSRLIRAHHELNPVIT